MRVVWDAGKDLVNRQKHGLGFEAVSRLDWDSVLEVEDTRFDYGERRWRAIGKIDGRLHVLTHTVGDDAIRVISLRKANERETRLYAQA